MRYFQQIKLAKIDIYLSLYFLLIICLHVIPVLVGLFIIPLLIISYYKIFIKGEFTPVLLLMLIARCIMGPLLPGNNFAFNVLNILCNYLPFLLYILRNYQSLNKINTYNLINLKWTIVFTSFLILYSFFDVLIALPVFAREVLPLIMFLLVMLIGKEVKLDYDYIIKFFRYTFIASFIVYLSPNYSTQLSHLLGDAIIFKDSIPNVHYVMDSIPRHAGYVFDYRIQGQLSLLYFLILYYSRRLNTFDIGLLSLVAISTFSRGPLVMLLLLIIGVFFLKNTRFTTKKILVIFSTFLFIMTLSIYVLQMEKTQEYISTFNPLSEKNAISQRAKFSEYAFAKFVERPLGRGVGALSSPNADNQIFITNLKYKNNEPLYYYSVTDAYLAMSLGEKGIIGFTLMILSLIEIFFHRKNIVSLLFLLGLFLNLIGTDIPKEGFYYFVILVIYFDLSRNFSHKSENKLSIDNP